MYYEELDRLLDSLEDAIEDENPQKGYWRELWGLVSLIKEELKTTRYPEVKMKHDAVERLKELIRAAEHKSEVEKSRREERQREWEQRIAQSNRARRDVERKIAGTQPVSNLERMIASVVLAPLNALETALNSILGLEQLDEVHEDLKACNANMKEAWNIFSESKYDLLPGDKNELYRQLKEAQERLNAAWNQWKGMKNRAYEERRRAWEERQQEREEKHRNFVDRVEANIAKLEAKISKAEYALERQLDHLSDLEDKYRDAWNEDFKERCGEWIEETEDRIQSIKDSIDQWKEWLAQEYDKLHSKG